MRLTTPRTKGTLTNMTNYKLIWKQLGQGALLSGLMLTSPACDLDALLNDLAGEEGGEEEGESEGEEAGEQEGETEGDACEAEMQACFEAFELCLDDVLAEPDVLAAHAAADHQAVGLREAPPHPVPPRLGRVGSRPARGDVVGHSGLEPLTSTMST